jgi:alpha-N-arabinofuranosidase
VAVAFAARSAEFQARVLREGKDPARATLRVHTQPRSPFRIPKRLTGKFAEHLWFNVSNGMDAQVLLNPTFADYPVAAGQTSPDGVAQFHWEARRINEGLRHVATRFGWSDPELDEMLKARADGLASLWTRVGEREAVQVSPDVGPCGGRAQRVRVHAAAQGIGQWVYLPLHRQRTYQLELLVRSPDVRVLTVWLAPSGSEAAPGNRASIKGLSARWQRLAAKLRAQTDWPADAPIKLSITADSPGQFVLAQALLRPVDHVQGADPDVVRLLRDSKLPILRWPGGNFVSGYHWEDGVGPLEKRQTRPNYAWGNVEPNLFGADEFIAFCRAVGCEPMICVNAGSGTPEEAARWVQYCNSPPSTPMGARRTANGHREPYNVRHWEIGNELWGRWQFYWTSAEGYADRYLQFAESMRKADPTIELYACGAPVLWGKQWNDTLLSLASSGLKITTDHPLIGGDVKASVEPLDVYRDFMAIPEILEQKWAALRGDMERAGIKEPRLAVTELQMFAHLAGGEPTAPVLLTRERLVQPATLAEGLYDVLIYHAAVRLAPFVEMVTHSATVNHGGGLRKERERVYANPCHYAQAAFADFNGATPVPVELECARERAPLVLPDLRNIKSPVAYTMVDALAALAQDGSLLLSLVHRGTSGPITLELDLEQFKAAGKAEVRTLSAEVPWAVNSLAHPQAVAPVDSIVQVRDGKARLELQPFTVARVRVPAR